LILKAKTNISSGEHPNVTVQHVLAAQLANASATSYRYDAKIMYRQFNKRVVQEF